MTEEVWAIEIVGQGRVPDGFKVSLSGRSFVMLVRSKSWRVRAMSVCCDTYIRLIGEDLVCEDCSSGIDLSYEDTTVSSWGDRDLQSWLAAYACYAGWYGPLAAEIAASSMAKYMTTMAQDGLDVLARKDLDPYGGFRLAASEACSRLQQNT